MKLDDSFNRMKFQDQKSWLDFIKENEVLFRDLIQVSPSIIAQKDFLRDLLALEKKDYFLKVINSYAKTQDHLRHVRKVKKSVKKALEQPDSNGRYLLEELTKTA